MADVTLTVKIDKHLKKQFDELCEEDHRTMAGQIRRMIENFVEKSKED